MKKRCADLSATRPAVNLQWQWQSHKVVHHQMGFHQPCVHCRLLHIHDQAAHCVYSYNLETEGLELVLSRSELKGPPAKATPLPKCARWRKELKSRRKVVKILVRWRAAIFWADDWGFRENLLWFFTVLLIHPFRYYLRNWSLLFFFFSKFIIFLNLSSCKFTNKSDKNMLNCNFSSK